MAENAIRNLNIDSHKLMYHPERVAAWKKGERPAPLQVEVGLTNRCNHDCTFCGLDYAVREGGAHDIDTDVMLDTLKDMVEYGVRAVYFAGEGEPTLHKGLTKIVKRAHELGIKTSISTNGSLLNERIASGILPHLLWARFSLDAGTPEAHYAIHRSNDYDKVMDNIERSAKIKRDQGLDVNIGVQAIMLPGNIGGLIDLGRSLRDFGVNNIQLKPFINHPLSSNRMDNIDCVPEGFEEEIKRLNTDNFTVIYRSNAIARGLREEKCVECFGVNFTSVISAKGNVIPCNMYFEDPDFTYGNINDKKFSEIWRSDRRIEINEKIDSNKDKGCEGYRCRFDATNEYLERVVNPKPGDDFA